MQLQEMRVRSRVSRFVTAKQQRIPEYIQAVTALEALAQENEDLASRALAEATCEVRRKVWAQREGVKESTGHVCVARLLGKRCRMSSSTPRRGEVPPCRPPGADHPKLWLRNGKPAIYTFEPYVMELNTLRELVNFCDRWGLDLEIRGWPGAHFPGHVVWVELRPAKRTDDEET